MTHSSLETDYLVIGSGAAGMAFTDALLADSNADVIMVDRRHAPGGHWNEAYPFVRLHQPSAYYGVNSLVLGNDRIDPYGPNAGFYEQASAAEICAYYDRVMQQQFLPSGRVRYFPMCHYQGKQRFVAFLTGTTFEVNVKRKVVDARYLETSVPNSTPPPFQVMPGVRCVPVNRLTQAERSSGFVIIGAGKTAMDACFWLLKAGVSPAAIRWIKPREAWLQNRKFLQSRELVGTQLEGLVLQLEAALAARTVDDLFEGLETSEQFLRVDRQQTPTMYRGPTLSELEVHELRRITQVVRLGHVVRIERDSIILEHGTETTSPDWLHVHCATEGLNPAAGTPVFREDQIVLQSIRTGLIPFNAALIGYIEATRDNLEQKNQLCPPNRQPNVPIDWVRGMVTSMLAAQRWSKEPDIEDWLERSRLNLTCGLQQLGNNPEVQRSLERFTKIAGPALANLAKLAGEKAS